MTPRPGSHKSGASGKAVIDKARRHRARQTGQIPPVPLHPVDLAWQEAGLS